MKAQTSSQIHTRSSHSIGLTSISEEGEGSTATVQLPPRIRCQYDVIWSFLDEFLDMIIQDYQVLESKPPEPEFLNLLGPDSENVYIKEYQDLNEQDMETAEVVSVKGSNVVLKKKIGQSASLNISPKVSRQKVPKGSRSMNDVLRSKTSLQEKSSSPSIEIPSNRSSSTTVTTENEEMKKVRITFRNGNVYEGQAVRNKMCGKGQFLWGDGTFYEGEFKDGLPNGHGDMLLPDMSRYSGGFKNGLYHGKGVLNVAMSEMMLYSGGWINGKKHGQGWLVYGPNNWYDGGWQEDKKHGLGFRRYKDGARFKGMHNMGKRRGYGSMIWRHNDYYKGHWKDDLFDGTGEYIWRTCFNQAFVFPVHNVYKGRWADGKRNGPGVMCIGNGAKLEGTFVNNFKHGHFIIHFGNGQVIPRDFQNDKPVIIASDLSVLSEAPIFSIGEHVNVGFYIEEILERVKEDNTSMQSLGYLRQLEETAVKNTLALFLPQLKELYETYAVLYAGDEPVNFKPVMVRMILWQFYRDLEVPTTLHMSIMATDDILTENPDSCVETEHYPFEHIHFWQFLLSLVGLAFKTKNLQDLVEDEMENSVLAPVLKQFFTENVFSKLPPKKQSPNFKYKNLVPIKNVYKLYRSLGEPVTAHTFLRKTCLRKGQEPKPTCYMERANHKFQAGKYGENIVPIYEKISFKNFPKTEFPEQADENTWAPDESWQNLIEFRHLGVRSVVKCLVEACPAIMEEGLLVNIDYPLSFLEFYDVLLYCIFLVIERELAWAKKQIPGAETVREVKKVEEKGSFRKKGKGKKK